MQKLSAMLAQPYDFSYTDLTGDHALQFTPTAVYRGRKTVSEAKYAISVLEAPRAVIGSPADLEGSQRAEDWTLNVQGWPPEDRTNPSDPAYVMAAAVRQRLGRLIAADKSTGEPVYTADFLFGNMVNNIAFGATIVSPPTEGVSEYAFWYVPMVISLVQQTRAV
jgi:hypothetical protein